MPGVEAAAAILKVRGSAMLALVTGRWFPAELQSQKLRKLIEDRILRLVAHRRRKLGNLRAHLPRLRHACLGTRRQD